MARFPIPAAPHMERGDALRLDRDNVLPAAKCNYVFANPPFGGHVTRARPQTSDPHGVWEEGYAKCLDDETGWHTARFSTPGPTYPQAASLTPRNPARARDAVSTPGSQHPPKAHRRLAPPWEPP